ncbi:inner membrane protein YjiY [Anaerotignum neopropionicum]|uniref:Inner membrane protein YjiY n=1 Tax=Anaerotignum neopropionicum TaxID=36847 RepID=A0A136WHJ8_9FIRM|nr:carbon starvation CstA family protein [Anaerotignum neopropionicum]KXL54001.1 inner membrane protein YjiY [Anaerotignum neopropionicum]
MISFFVCLAILIVGYLLYGAFVERTFKPDDRPTPATTMADGTDYVVMSNPKIFLIQLLNIAGLGPIYGAIAGALWGPSVFLWITFGTIFAGGVHDYLAGMISMRHKGTSISEIVGIYLGPFMKTVMRIFSVVLLVLVGTVFATGPSALLAMLTPAAFNAKFWLVVVIAYYFLATLVPIDKLIGKVYPIFGICLIVMAIGVAGGIIIKGYTIPEIAFNNLHPKGTAIWPFMFITVACGAISGFHATQSPLMARCMKSEKDGRKIFYGAMVCEGVIALIWAAAGVAFYEGTGGLAEAITRLGGQGGVVYEICNSLLGPIGAVIAMVGVIACPISSGDTAFRSARLVISDWFKVDQQKIKTRLMVTIPLLAIGALLSQVDITIIWRYFSWSNQTLAMIALWAAAAYLRKNEILPWIAAVPATFMSAVSCTYILMAPEGFKLGAGISYPAGIIFAAVCLGLFVVKFMKKAPSMDQDIAKNL